MLCPIEPTGGEDCLRIEPRIWGQLAVDHVVRQWNGELVEVTGFLWRSGFRVWEMRLLEARPSPAFCEGFLGPLEPAPAEDEYDNAWQHWRSRQPLPGGAELRLHPYKAVLGVFPRGWADRSGPVETVVFEVPEPWAGRDIEKLVAFSKAHFVFWLRDGSTFSWRHGDLVEFLGTPGPPEHFVLGADGNLYYSVTRGDSTPRGVRSEVRRLAPGLEVTTIWESTSRSVTGMSWAGWTEGAAHGLTLELEWLPEDSDVFLCPDGREIDVSDYEPCSGEGAEIDE